MQSKNPLNVLTRSQIFSSDTMPYTLQITPSCKRDINKLCRKNTQLQEILEKKINEILNDPLRYKTLKNDLSGLRRVHIQKSFILVFEVNESQESVILQKFSHHDAAYKH